MKYQNFFHNRFILPILSILIAVTFCVVYTNHKTASLQKRYVMVDTDAISKQFLATIIRANLADEQYKALLIQYDKTLTNVIVKVSEANNFVILKKTVILTPLPDLTKDIQKIVFDELKLDRNLAEKYE